MALLNFVDPEKAEGEVKESYDMFLNSIGQVPKPFQMMSVSPGLMKVQQEVLKYFMNHPTLSLPLMTLIRYLSATACSYDFCINFNQNLLKMQGMEDAELEAVKKNPSTAPLEDKEVAMLVFVVNTLNKPQEVKQADVDNLRSQGWADRDIFDAVVHGANMFNANILMTAFQLD